MSENTHGGKRSGAGCIGDRATRLAAQWLAGSEAVTVTHARRLLNDDPDAVPKIIRQIITMGIEAGFPDSEIYQCMST